MKVTSRYFTILIAIVALFFSSCKEKSQLDLLTDVKGNYFSVNQYIIDEWWSNAGEVQAFKKTVKRDGKIIDTGFTNAELMDWPSVLNVFIATDISDRKFINKYTFSQFDDELDNTHNFMYVANKADMFVQKLLITMDVNSMKVRGIYIETYDKSIWSEKTQKLLYSPRRIIQIQEYSKPLIGAESRKVEQYEMLK